MRWFVAAFFSIVLFGAVSSPRLAAPAGFTGVGHLSTPPISSNAEAVSGDGTTVVDSSHNGTSTEAHRWTAPSGIVGLGYLPGGTNQSNALDVSSDGSVVVGGSSTAPSNRIQAFIWRAETGLVPVGEVPTFGGQESTAIAVSSDGSVIAGQTEELNGAGGTRVPFHWSESSGFTLINAGTATDISGDGSTVVGDGGTEAYRWTNAGLIGLGDLPGGAFRSVARGYPKMATSL